MKAVKFLVLLIALAAAWFYFTGSKQQPPPQKTTQSTVAKQPAQKPLSPSFGTDNGPQPEVEAIPDNWPPVNAGDVQTAPDLLARNYYVIFDSSGSMKEQQCYGDGSKIEVAKQALSSFAKLVPSRANLGLSVFMNNNISEMVPLAVNNREPFIAAVNSATPSGGTPLHTAITTGYRRLTDQASMQRGYGEYVLVIMTDGIPSKGEDPTGIVQAIIEKTPIEIHTIGFCIGENHALNMPGKTVYKAANSQEDLQRGLTEVLAESASFDVSEFGSGEK